MISMKYNCQPVRDGYYLDSFDNKEFCLFHIEYGTIKESIIPKDDTDLAEQVEEILNKGR